MSTKIESRAVPRALGAVDNSNLMEAGQHDLHSPTRLSPLRAHFPLQTHPTRTRRMPATPKVLDDDK
eukprot:2477986-Rhodomonas_salina.1